MKIKLDGEPEFNLSVTLLSANERRKQLIIVGTVTVNATISFSMVAVEEGKETSTYVTGYETDLRPNFHNMLRGWILHWAGEPYWPNASDQVRREVDAIVDPIHDYYAGRIPSVTNLYDLVDK